MSVKVKQTYRNGEAVSVTRRNGFVTKVTIWNPGAGQPNTRRTEFPANTVR